MSGLRELTETKAALTAIEAEIAAETEKFEESIAPLRAQREELRHEYAAGLRAELASMDPSADPKPALGGILAAIERNHQPVIIKRIRELTGRYFSAHEPVS